MYPLISWYSSSISYVSLEWHVQLFTAHVSQSMHTDSLYDEIIHSP